MRSCQYVVGMDPVTCVVVIVIEANFDAGIGADF
jgi:hypothetical protein